MVLVTIRVKQIASESHTSSNDDSDMEDVCLCPDVQVSAPSSDSSASSIQKVSQSTIEIPQDNLILDKKKWHIQASTLPQGRNSVMNGIDHNDLTSKSAVYYNGHRIRSNCVPNHQGWPSWPHWKPGHLFCKMFSASHKHTHKHFKTENKNFKKCNQLLYGNDSY